MKKRLRETNLFSKKSLCIIAIMLSICCLILMLSPKDNYYVLKKINQKTWFALIENDYVSESIIRDSIWEPRETRYLLKNMKANDIVIEIGTHIGYYTILMAQLLSRGHIYSYEANDAVFELAELSLKMNDLSHIVTLKNVCITDKAGEVNFAYSKPSAYCETNIGASHICVGNNFAKGLQKKVKAISLDEDLPNLKNVDWLRMDIEGAELLAIHGAKKIIESSPNLKIVMEWIPKMLKNFGSVSELIDLLHSYGFKFYDIGDDGSLSKEIIKSNLLSMEYDSIVLIRDDVRKYK